MTDEEKAELDAIVSAASNGLRKSLAEIAAANPVPETGWLIELRGNSPQWWSLTDTEGEGGYFTNDSLKALRFARKQDAEAVIEDIGWTEAFASEHQWG